MELHAVQRPLAVAQRHHRAVVVGPRGDLERRRPAVVGRRPASGSGRPRTAPSGRRTRRVPSCSTVERLAVHQPRRAHDLPAEGRAHRLVAETDAEDRHASGRSAGSTSIETPASSGRPGPGEITMRDGASAAISSSVICVVAAHRDLGAELAEVLREVEGERVVVVDRARTIAATSSRLRAARAARSSACAPCLCVSSYSAAGIRVGDDAGAGLDLGDAVAQQRSCGWRCRSRGCRRSRGSRPRRRRRRATTARARR